MRKIEMGQREVAVIVDGNRAHLQKNGKDVRISTTVENGIITLKKCQEITQKIRDNFNYEPEELMFLMSIFEETDKTDIDNPATCLLDKHAEYDVKKNRLRIWQTHELIYENEDGMVCKDPVALADCYND